MQALHAHGAAPGLVWPTARRSFPSTRYFRHASPFRTLHPHHAGRRAAAPVRAIRVDEEKVSRGRVAAVPTAPPPASHVLLPPPLYCAFLIPSFLQQEAPYKVDEGAPIGLFPAFTRRRERLGELAARPPAAAAADTELPPCAHSASTSAPGPACAWCDHSAAADRLNLCTPPASPACSGAAGDAGSGFHVGRRGADRLRPHDAVGC